MSVFVFGMSVSGFGLPVVVTREVARNQSGAGRWFVQSSALSIALLLPIVLLGVAACILGNADRSMGLALGLTALSILPSAITQQAEAVLLAFERAQDFVLINLGETVLRAVFGTVLVLSGFGVVGIAALLLALRVCAAVAFALTLQRRGVRLSPQLDGRLLRQLAAYIPVTGLIPVVNALYARADVFVLSSLGTWHDVGVYSAALRLVDLARTIPPAYARAIYPVLARMRARGRKRVRRGRHPRHAQRTAAGHPAGARPVRLAGPAIRLLFGPELAPAAGILARPGVDRRAVLAGHRAGAGPVRRRSAGRRSRCQRHQHGWSASAALPSSCRASGPRAPRWRRWLASTAYAPLQSAGVVRWAAPLGMGATSAAWRWPRAPRWSCCWASVARPDRRDGARPGHLSADSSPCSAWSRSTSSAGVSAGARCPPPSAERVAL